MSRDLKAEVSDFWENAACGERLLLPTVDRAGFSNQAKERYRLEPFIVKFAQFDHWRGKRVLEIGVGLGADHQRFAEAGARITGVDLTSRAIALTRERFAAFSLKSELMVGDAEELLLPDNEFDLVYSWGVIHHSPNTECAIEQILRVLRPGGVAKIMIYNKWSLVGLMLWLRYALLPLSPVTSMREIYAKHLESPGTKAYSIAEARQLFEKFSDVTITTVLSHGDLLSSNAGQRHRGPLLTVMRRVWPRWLISRFLQSRGLFMMIEARKR
jgi:ubiquinone/menaquinone biosynthesis C-methylase UbiE